MTAFGPGLVFFLAAVGAEDLVANSVAGLGYRYSLLWTLPVILLARFVILEASARYVLATGESLPAGYCRVSRWAAWLILVAILLRLHLHHLGSFLLIGGAADLLAPLPTTRSAKIWAVLFWALGFALMYWGRYRAVERWCRPLLLVLGGSLAAAALMSKPDPAALVRGALIPSVPEQQGAYSYALVLIALAGAGASSLGNLKYAAFVHEKGWRDLSFLKIQRVDLLLSVCGILLMSALIQIVAAGAFGQTDGRLETAEDLVPLFSRTLGEMGRVVLGLGLWSAVFTTYLGSTTGYSLLVADLWRNLVGAGGGTRGAAGEHPAYRWWLGWFCVSPLYVIFTDWQPVWLVLLSSALTVVVMPLVVLVLLRLTTDRARMGEHANGWVTNAALVSVALVSVYLIWRNALLFWGALQRTLGA